MRIQWGPLSAVRPTIDEVHVHADALAAAYNDPRNSALLGNTQTMSRGDVVEHYEALLADAHPFLLFNEGVLAGDADIRGGDEFAFLIAAPSQQGKGLGTRFATMIHVFAFRELELAALYASVIPANVASRRVFEKLGYREVAEPDRGDPGDVVLRIDRATFESRPELAEIRLVR